MLKFLRLVKKSEVCARANQHCFDIRARSKWLRPCHSVSAEFYPQHYNPVLKEMHHVTIVSSKGSTIQEVSIEDHWHDQSEYISVTVNSKFECDAAHISFGPTWLYI